MGGQRSVTVGGGTRAAVRDRTRTARPLATGVPAGGTRSGVPVWDVLVGLLGSGLAVGTMAGAAALGLWLLGAGGAVPLLPAAGAVVALAVGCRVDVSGTPATDGRGPSSGSGGLGLPFPGGAGRLVELIGSVEVVPLGILACGILALAATLLLGRPRGPAARISAARIPAARISAAHGPAVRAATMAVAFPTMVYALVGAVARGRIAAGDRLTLAFRADPGAALPRALGLVLAVIGLYWLASRRAPLPAPLRCPAARVRPVVSAVVVVLAALVVAVTATGLLAAPLAGRVSGARVAGAVLLGGPNLVAAGLPAGVGVPFAVEKPATTGATGTATGTTPRPSGGDGGGARRRAPDLSRLVPGVERYQRALSRLSEASRPSGSVRLLAAIVTAVALLACGVLVAARTPEPGTRGGPVARVVRNAARLGVAMAVVMPVLVALSGASAGVGASVFGFQLLDVGFGVHGDALRAVVLGLLSGAAGGLLGGLLWWPVARVAARRESGRGWWRGAAPRGGRRTDGS